METEQLDGFPGRTNDGEDVRIVAKEADPQRGLVLVSDTGNRYVVDPATMLLLATEKAPLAPATKTAEQEAAVTSSETDDSE